MMYCTVEFFSLDIPTEEAGVSTQGQLWYSATGAGEGYGPCSIA